MARALLPALFCCSRLSLCIAELFMSIAENVEHIRERMRAAAARARRDAGAITLMAVTKTFLPELIREAHEAGVRVFGENHVQEFAGKAAALGDLREARWHMIGHLQS